MQPLSGLRLLDVESTGTNELPQSRLRFPNYGKYKEEQEDLQLTKKSKKGGGDFYRNQNVRIGKRFAHAVIQATKEGRLLYRDAYRLTGLHEKTFNEYSIKLGIN